MIKRAVMQLLAQESQGEAKFARYADDMPCGVGHSQHLKMKSTQWVMNDSSYAYPVEKGTWLEIVTVAVTVLAASSRKINEW